MSDMLKNYLFFICGWLLLSPNLYALDYSVDLSTGVRSFLNSPLGLGLGYEDHYDFSGFASGEFSSDIALSDFSFKTRIYSTWDNEDSHRRYINPQQAQFQYSNGQVSVSAGIDTFYWGVSETINILNTLNQSDFRKTTDGKSKVGVPNVGASYILRNHIFRVIYLTDFVELKYPVRPSSRIPINSDQASCEAGACQSALALRWEQSYDFGDLSFGFFDGTRTDPLLIANKLNPDFLTPYYLATQYLTMDGVAFLGELLLKVELKYGEELSDMFHAFNIGLEYPIFPEIKWFNSASLVFEYLYDKRGRFSETIGQNDLFFGGRFRLGDLDQASARAIIGIDSDYGSRYFDLSLEYRISDYVRFRSSAIYFSNVSSDDKRLFLVENESFLEAAIHVAF